jgi:hypothetical protein
MYQVAVKHSNIPFCSESRVRRLLRIWKILGHLRVNPRSLSFGVILHRPTVPRRSGYSIRVYKFDSEFLNPAFCLHVDSIFQKVVEPRACQVVIAVESAYSELSFLLPAQCSKSL